MIPLRGGGEIYTSNVYLVLGDWSRLEDANTLVDVGRDPAVLQDLAHAPTGVGKKKVDRVVLTHSHYDHVELLPDIRAAFHPEVCAKSRQLEGVHRILENGDRVLMGDQMFEAIAVYGHTADSLCLFNPITGTLFSGDAPLWIQSAGMTYEPEFVDALEGLCRRDIRVVYPGHGDPIAGNCNERLRASLETITRPTRPAPISNIKEKP